MCCCKLPLAFKTAKHALEGHKTSDALWILTNDSVSEQQRHRSHTVCTPNDQLLLAGFFAVKLCKHQVTWLPCEIKALAIATAIKHIIKHVHIIQSSHLMVVLTVSSPCVHANEKLKREEFSTSSRATTFLSTVCHYFVYVLLIAGVENFPSDFGSRNPWECLESSCQNCMCLVELENSIVRSISVSEVLMAL